MELVFLISVLFLGGAMLLYRRGGGPTFYPSPEPVMTAHVAVNRPNWYELAPPDVAATYEAELLRASLMHAPDGTEVSTLFCDGDDPSELAATIQKASDQGAHVVMILAAGPDSDELQRAVRSAQERGIVVSAFGTKQKRFFPGDYDGVFAIAPQPGLGVSMRLWNAPNAPLDPERPTSCFLVPSRLPDGETEDEVVPLGLFGGWAARAVAHGTKSHTDVQQALEAYAAASQTTFVASDLPFPELARLPFPTQLQLALMWGSRLTQTALGGAEEDATVLRLRTMQAQALAGISMDWFGQGVQLLMQMAPGIGQPLGAIHGGVAQQNPEALPRMALALQACLNHDARVQRLQLDPPRQIHVGPYQASDVAQWLLHMARHLSQDWDDATRTALEAVGPEGTLPRAPDPALEAVGLQLHTWLDLAHYAQRLLTGEAVVNAWSTVACHMASSCTAEQLLGKGEHLDEHDPEAVAFLPEAHRASLLDASIHIHRRALHWDLLDPGLDGLAKRCLEPLRRHAAVAEVLDTWAMGSTNRMAARFPSMDRFHVPVAVPWVRAEQALRPLRDTSPEAAIAWYAMRQLIDGGLHGDDDTNWIAKVHTAASILDPGAPEDGWIELMDQLGAE